MEAKKIEYFEGGEIHDFIENDVMNEKLEIFTNFLIRSGINFKVKYFEDMSGKLVYLGDGIICAFYKSGKTNFEYDEEYREEDDKN